MLDPILQFRVLDKAVFVQFIKSVLNALHKLCGGFMDDLVTENVDHGAFGRHDVSVKMNHAVRSDIAVDVTVHIIIDSAGQSIRFKRPIDRIGDTIQGLLPSLERGLIDPLLLFGLLYFTKHSGEPQLIDVRIGKLIAVFTAFDELFELLPIHTLAILGNNRTNVF